MLIVVHCSSLFVVRCVSLVVVYCCVCCFLVCLRRCVLFGVVSARFVCCLSVFIFVCGLLVNDVFLFACDCLFSSRC